MKIAVCDDDKRIREQLKAWILEYEKQNCEVYLYQNGETLCAARISFDAVFLDIDMEDMNGIEAARWIRRRDKDVKIIYVTSYREYVNGAFSVHAFSYLLKPVTRKTIWHQIEEVLAYKKPERSAAVVEFLTADGVEHLPTDEIYYFEFLDRKIYMYTKKKVYTLKGRISDIEEQMNAHDFAAPHKSFVVNLYYVKTIKGYDIQMMNGDVIPLSQKKSVAFRKRLSDFLVNYIGD